MNNLNLENVINRAKKLGSYFITITTRDKGLEENDLTHFVFKEDFSQDDIISSLDASVRSLKVSPPKTPVVTAPKLSSKEERKPLKIAILSHFNRMPDSYSPGKAVRNQIKMLGQFGHEVVFFTMEGSKLTKDDIGCEVRNLVPAFKRKKHVINEDAKKRFIDVLREQLTSDFDIAISHDFYIDDCITYREAIRECGVVIPWLHFARSGVGTSFDFSMPSARYIYLNKADTGIFARRINVDIDRVRSVYNEKEPAFFFNWHPITKMISDKFELWNRDIIQTYPMCTTRMGAKGIQDAIRIFGKLKEMGQKVALIIANSNGRKRIDDIKNIQEIGKHFGLTDQELIFTSLLSTEEYKTESEVPNSVVAQLMQISNLFIFPTRAENGPNVLLEASMAKNLLVLNEDLPLLYDFADKENVISFPFTSNRSLHYTSKDDESIDRLAKQIVGQLKSNKSDLQFRRIWRNHNVASIYSMLEPILYEESR